MSIAVFGHQNPDTDAIVSALVYASFLSKTHEPAQAFRLGDLNRETLFVLEHANVARPHLITELPANSPVALVDHNEAGQSIPNLKELKITRIVDHHKWGGLDTPDPVYLRFEPLGSTATILTKLYIENHVPIEQWEAKLLLSAILSDTLHFRSPTTTETDREMAAYLSPIAEIIDLGSYALDMFAAKSNLADVTAHELLKMDYKVFTFGGRRYGMGVIETTHPSPILDRQDELMRAMQDEKTQDNLAGIFLSVVDILQETHQMLVLGTSEENTIKGAFGVSTEHGRANLGNLLSRKKQIVPAFEQYFSVHAL